MANEQEWEVRGCLDSEVPGHKRFKYGHSKVGARLETRLAIVHISLTADGILTLNFAKPGSHRGRLVLKGKLSEVAGGQLGLTPALGSLGLVIDQEQRHNEHGNSVQRTGGGGPDPQEYSGGPGRAGQGPGGGS